MSNDKNNYGLEEQRRKKAENFKLNIRDNYDDDGSETEISSDELEILKEGSVEELPEEILRLFTFSKAEEAFRRLHATGLMERLLPDLAAHVARSGGARAPLWRYLAALDRAFGKGLETENRSDPRFVQENALRLAALLAPLYRERLAADSGNAMLLAEDLVANVLVRPFASPGWRPPRLLWEDLCCILESLVR